VKPKVPRMPHGDPLEAAFNQNQLPHVTYGDASTRWQTTSGRADT
jgi:hypothetical protein